jgi:putative endonuclease
MADGWWLYLIECQGYSLYTGITTDVAARYAAHCAGKGARYTRMYPPVRLLAVQSYPTRSEASKAEHAMKKRTAAEKRRWALAMSLAG